MLSAEHFLSNTVCMGLFPTYIHNQLLYKCGSRVCLFLVLCLCQKCRCDVCACFLVKSRFFPQGSEEGLVSLQLQNAEDQKTDSSHSRCRSLNHSRPLSPLLSALQSGFLLRVGVRPALNLFCCREMWLLNVYLPCCVYQHMFHLLSF